MSRRLAFAVVGLLVAVTYLAWVGVVAAWLALGASVRLAARDARETATSAAASGATARARRPAPAPATPPAAERPPDAIAGTATPGLPESADRPGRAGPFESPGNADASAEPTDRPTRRVTATPEPPRRGPTLPSAVDWPKLAEVGTREPLTATTHFHVFAEDPGDPVLAGAADRWAPEVEELLADVTERLAGRGLPQAPVQLVFSRAYAARCPARGLASTGHDPPLIMIFVDDDTTDVQVRAVLAHEITHHVTLDDRFVGDGILTEGIANWGAGRQMLAWQGVRSWEAAVRGYLVHGDYVSIADATALNPRPGEDCIARRDRVYNIRTAFVDWLIVRVGLDRVLAMPYVEIETPARDDAAADVQRVPDYAAATGADLAMLERLWLRDLAAPARPEARVVPDRRGEPMPRAGLWLAQAAPAGPGPAVLPALSGWGSPGVRAASGRPAAGRPSAHWSQP